MKFIAYMTVSLLLPALSFFVGAWLLVRSFEICLPAMQGGSGWHVVWGIILMLVSCCLCTYGICGPMVGWALFAKPGKHGCTCPSCYRGFKEVREVTCGRRK